MSFDNLYPLKYLIGRSVPPKLDEFSENLKRFPASLEKWVSETDESRPAKMLDNLSKEVVHQSGQDGGGTSLGNSSTNFREAEEVSSNSK